MSKEQPNQPEKPEESTDQDVCADSGVVSCLICNHRSRIAFFIVGVIAASVTAGLAVRLLKPEDCSNVFVTGIIQKIDQIRGDTTEGVVPVFIEYHVDDNRYKLNVIMPDMLGSQKPLPLEVPQCPDDEKDKEDKVIRI